MTAIVLYRKRRWVLRQNGTAYVIQELAGDWDRQDEKAFLESAGRYFARVIRSRAPAASAGPGTGRWVPARSLGRQGRRAGSLVPGASSDDDPDTPNGILMWASWAVAVAFGMRVTAADRDLVLDVWQRPSHGRAGDVETVMGTQRPHRFGYTGASAAGRAAA